MLVVILAFLGAFLVTALLLSTIGIESRVQSKTAFQRLSTLTSVVPGQLLEEPVNLRREQTVSNIAPLNAFLQRLQLTPKLRLLLYQSGLGWRAGDILLASVAILVLVAWLVYERTGAGALSVIIGMAASLLPLMYVVKRRKMRFDTFEEMLPEALDLMVGALRAGHSLSSALNLAAKEMAEPIGPEFRQCVDEQNFGLDLRAALMNLVTRVPIPDVRTTVTAVLIQRETGGNLAEILEKVAYVIRERFRLRRQIRVHTAQGRMTGWILTLLPIVLGVGLYLINPKHMSILWNRPIGIKMMWGAAISEVIGGLIIKKIVSIRV